jgi:hypothetical protein
VAARRVDCVRLDVGCYAPSVTAKGRVPSRHVRPLILALLGAVTVACGVTLQASPTRLVPTPSMSARTAGICDPSRPNGATPPGEQPSPQDYGNGRLYTGLGLSSDGYVYGDMQPDGSIGVKFGWFRAPDVGGLLKIEGHEVKTGALIRAEIPTGYGQRFQATGLYFPAAGCYEVTGQSGDASLTFVVKVRATPN